MSLESEESKRFRKFACLCIEFLIIVLPLIFFPGTSDNFIIKKVILALVLPLAYFGFIMGGRINRPLLWLPLVSYAGILAVSVINSANIRVSMNALTDQILLIAVYPVMLWYIDEQDTINRFLTLVLLSCVLVCLYGILQLCGFDFVRWSTDYSGRIASSLGNPNFLAGYLVAVLPLALGVLLLLKNKLLSLGIFMLLCVSLVLTRTRGSYLAGGIAILLWFILSLKYLKQVLVQNRKWLLAAGIFLAAGFTILVSTGQIPFRNTILSIFNPKIPSVQERFFKWQTAVEMIKDHPWLGVGVGAIKVNFALYQNKAQQVRPMKLRGTSESQVHNEYLQRGAESGIVGLAAFLWLVGAGIIRMIKSIHKVSDRERILQIALVSSVIGILLDSVPNFPLHIVPTAFLFWGYFGIGERMGHIDMPQPQLRPGTGKVLAVVVFAVYVSLIVPGTLRRFNADRLRAKGGYLFSLKQWRDASEAYAAANKLDPTDGQACYRWGMAYVSLKEWDKAINAFKQSIAIRNYGEVYNDLANCYYIKSQSLAGAEHKRLLMQALDAWHVAVRLGLPLENDQVVVRQNIHTVQNMLAR